MNQQEPNQISPEQSKKYDMSETLSTVSQITLQDHGKIYSALKPKKLLRI